MRWLKAAPSRWLGRSSVVQQDIASGTHGLSYLRNLIRGNRVRRDAAFETVPEGSRPLLVIHGFFGTRGSMYLLERRLVEDGFCVFSFDLGRFNIRDIRRSAFLIHRKIDRILAQTACKEIDIVAHSMGGLIGLYYIKKLGGHARVRKLVTLGTPYRGTWAALGGVAMLGLFSTSTWQLLPRSRFLDELHREPIPDGVEIYSIAAARDWFCPPSATRIQGGKAITVPFGHGSLVVSAEVYKHLKTILRRDAPASQGEVPGGPPGGVLDGRAGLSRGDGAAGPVVAGAAGEDRAAGADPGGGALAQRGGLAVTSFALTSRRGKGNA